MTTVPTAIAGGARGWNGGHTWTFRREFRADAGQSDLFVVSPPDGVGEFVLKEYRGIDEDTRRAARAEVTTLQKIHGDGINPCVAIMFDSNVDQPGRPWLVLEHIPGPTLVDALSSTKDPAWLVRLCRHLVGVMASIHRRDAAHRDFHPKNVILRTAGDPTTATLVDFGLSRTSTAATQTAKAAKTWFFPGFTSPEQLAGEGRPTIEDDQRGDVWSLGAVLHFALTRRYAYQSALEARGWARDLPGADGVWAHTMVALAKTPRVVGDAVSAYAPWVAPPLDEVIQRALALDPWSRYASAVEFELALREALGESPGARRIEQLEAALRAQHERIAKLSEAVVRIERDAATRWSAHDEATEKQQRAVATAAQNADASSAKLLGHVDALKKDAATIRSSGERAATAAEVALAEMRTTTPAIMAQLAELVQKHQSLNDQVIAAQSAIVPKANPVPAAPAIASPSTPAPSIAVSRSTRPEAERSQSSETPKRVDVATESATDTSRPLGPLPWSNTSPGWQWAVLASIFIPLGYYGLRRALEPSDMSWWGQLAPFVSFGTACSAIAVSLFMFSVLLEDETRRTLVNRGWPTALARLWFVWAAVGLVVLAFAVHLRYAPCHSDNLDECRVSCERNVSENCMKAAEHLRGWPSETFRLYERACSLGNDLGCENVFSALEGGNGVTKDLARALRGFTAYCSKGRGYSCWREAEIRRQTGESNVTRIQALLQRACLRGEDRACDDAWRAPPAPSVPAVRDADSDR
ncbi:MAG: protein kinase [Polyangiales bacterium]